MKKFLVVYSVLNLFFASVAYATLPFPQVKMVEDEEILNRYTPYLDFVAEAARTTDAAKANQMVKLFDQLKKSDPEQAAHFLKGLRLELDHGIDLVGADPRKLKSMSPQIRRVVARSLGNWVSELDESLFRASTSGIAKAKAE